MSASAAPPIPADALTRTERARLQARVSAEIRRMDLLALLHALDALGYDEARIAYRSNPTAAHTAGLFESIAFTGDGVHVTVNLGLMSNQGPLPSYFGALLADQRDSALTELLWFFEDQLLRRRVLALCPERDEALLPRFPDTRRALVSLLRLSAPCCLHWLFQRVFPELEVAVRRRVAERPMQTSATHLGVSHLGDSSALGGLTRLPIGALEVQLSTDEWEAAGGEPWPRAALARLRRHVLPLLTELDAPLLVLLLLRDRDQYARLSPDHLLGYDPVQRGADAPARRRAQLVELHRSTPAKNDPDLPAPPAHTQTARRP